MKLFTIVLNWNGRDYIGKCLDSLQQQTIPSQIVVVDNGSNDGSIELIEANYPDVHLIKKSRNYGFAGGVNIGIRYAMGQDAKMIALFNNDAIAHKDWLKNLTQALTNSPEAGIVTSRLLRSDRKHIDSTGDFYSIWGMPFPRGRNQPDKGQFDTQTDVFGASGGASLYRVSMFQDIGLFDEKFFAYYEDVDISFRAQLAKWRVIYCPQAVAYHKISATSSRLGSFTRYHSVKNFFILYTKNMPGFLWFKYLPLFWLQAVRLALSSTLRGGLLAFLKGFARFFLYLPQIISDRHQIQRKRKVPLSYVDKLLYRSPPPRIPPAKD